MSYKTVQICSAVLENVTYRHISVLLWTDHCILMCCHNTARNTRPGSFRQEEIKPGSPRVVAGGLAWPGWPLGPSGQRRGEGLLHPLLACPCLLDATSHVPRPPADCWQENDCYQGHVTLTEDRDAVTGKVRTRHRGSLRDELVPSELWLFLVGTSHPGMGCPSERLHCELWSGSRWGDTRAKRASSQAVNAGARGRACSQRHPWGIC